MNSTFVWLKSLGLTLEASIDGSKLIISGLKQLRKKERELALLIAKENKPAILAELERQTKPEHLAQIAHAKRMLVNCPFASEKLHCWHCSRCGHAHKCMAWRERRQDVEFFQGSEEPYSVYLAGCLNDIQHGDDKDRVIQ